MNIELIGYAAAICTTLWSLPQTIKALRTRSISDISPTTTIIFICSMIIATAFAYGIHSRPVIATNLAGILIFLPVVIMRLSSDATGRAATKTIPLYLAPTVLICAFAPVPALGYLAGAINWWSMIIQIKRCARTRQVNDISLLAISTRTVGLTLWTTYSLSIWIVPLFVVNAVSLVLAVVLISMRLAYIAKR